MNQIYGQMGHLFAKKGEKKTIFFIFRAVEIKSMSIPESFFVVRTSFGLCGRPLYLKEKNTPSFLDILF